MYSAMHLTINHDISMRLIWLYDIFLQARNVVAPEHWKLLQNRSLDWRASLPVQYALKMTQTWTGLELPVGYDDLSTWPAPSDKEYRLWSHLMNRHTSVASKCKLFWPRCLTLLDKTKFFFNLLFPPAEFIRKVHQPLHDWLMPFSYVRRWWKWL